MVTQARRGRAFHPFALCTAIALAIILGVAAGCDKVPLTAPSGSVITLFAGASTVPVNGKVEIVATVIEHGVASTGTTTTTTPSAGTPVQNGTLVSFTTTLGHIDPRDARTNNGEVRVNFYPDGQSGLATITAYSGGASGKLENLKVGTAAVERVIISASPQTLGPGGGTSVITARAEDASGLGLADVPVTFTSDAGSLSPSTAITNAAGVATSTLVTSLKAKVTATVAGKTATVDVGLNPRTGVTIAGPTTSVSAGVPATFTVTVAGTANIKNVTIDFGDGRQQSLGALSGSAAITHTYATEGSYIARAIATDTSGFSEEVSTAVTILPGQPPSVTCTPSSSNPTVGAEVTISANVTGAISTITGYDWTFGSGSSYTGDALHTSGNRAQVRWSTQGFKVITIRVTQATGAVGEGACTVNVTL